MDRKSMLLDKFSINNGVLVWSKSDCTRIKKGDVAGTKRKNGYIYVNVDGKITAAHRIVWEMHNGTIPDGMYIDHINHIRDDNRIENLRLVTKIDNAWNMTKKKNNKSGVTGVSWDRRSKKWRAQITLFKRNIHLGEFNSFDMAVKVRREAEEFYGFHENHGK
nr:MAG TPA: homing endonuclease [Caudoviricetes sp.]